MICVCDDIRALAKTTLNAARTSSKNITSCFWNHSSIIESHYACKRCSNYPAIKLEPALQPDKNAKFDICHHMLTSSSPHNCKTGHFMSWKERERLRNVQKWQMHVQSVQNCCFSLSNMQICDVLVIVVVVVAKASYCLVPGRLSCYRVTALLHLVLFYCLTG